VKPGHRKKGKPSKTWVTPLTGEFCQQEGGGSATLLLKVGASKRENDQEKKIIADDSHGPVAETGVGPEREKPTQQWMRERGVWSQHSPLEGAGFYHRDQ